jgi:ERCC4-related helicase
MPKEFRSDLEKVVSNPKLEMEEIQMTQAEIDLEYAINETVEVFENNLAASSTSQELSKVLQMEINQDVENLSISKYEEVEAVSFLKKIKEIETDIKTWNSTQALMDILQVLKNMPKTFFDNDSHESFRRSLLRLQIIADSMLRYEAKELGSASKVDKLIEILKNLFRSPDYQQVIVFVNRRDMVNQVEALITEAKIPRVVTCKVVGHASMTVNQQRRAIQEFVEGRANVMITTR